MKRNTKLLIEALFIAIISIFLMYFYTGGKVNIFLTDDNYSEFYPVIEQSYRTLFKEGHLPIYNFYQMNGLIIADQGYYAQTNPIMLIAYILEHLSGMRVNLISIYIFIAFALGNALTYILLRKLNISRIASILAVGMLAISTSLITYCYWYHTYGNAIAIPIILLSILYSVKKENSKLSYFIGGIALAFSLSLGNIQFTFYHYAMYAVIMVLLSIIKKDKKYFIYLISNCLVAVVLSAPTLFIQFKAGSRRTGVIEENAYFMFPNLIKQQLLCSIIPGFLKNKFTGVFSYENGATCSDLGYGYLFSGLSLILLIAYICLIAFKLVKKIIKKEKIFKSKEEIFVFSISGAIIFLMWWALGKEWKLATVLSYIPAIKNFRYIFKITFIFTLLLPIATGYVLDRILKTKNKKLIIVKIFVILSTIIIIFMGCYNMKYTLTSGVNYYFSGMWEGDTQAHKKYKDVVNKLEEIGINKQNYRMIGFLENNGISTNEWIHYDDTRKNALYNFSKNMPTLLQVYSIGAYDTAMMNDTYSQCSKILSNKNLSFSWTNGISSYNFFIYYEQHPEELQELGQQIKNNSLKYYSFRKNSQYIEKFINLINNIDGLSVVNEYELSDNQIIIEIDGVDSLCQKQDGQKINVSGTIDRIYVDINDNNTSSVNLKLKYYDKIKAFYKDNKNKKKYLNVESDDNGYIIINGTENLENNKITVYYTYKLADLAIILSYVTFLMMLLIALKYLYNENKEQIMKIINKNKFVKFIFVGGTATCIDFVIYMILNNFINLSIAKVISMVTSCIYSYFLNKKWTFECKEKNNSSQIIKYTFSQIINVTTNVLVNFIIYKITNIKIIAYIIATLVAMTVNYVLQKKYVFRGVKK